MGELNPGSWAEILSNIISENEETRDQSTNIICDLLQNNSEAVLYLSSEVINNDGFSVNSYFQAFTIINRYFNSPQYFNRRKFYDQKPEIIEMVIRASFRGLLFKDSPFIQTAAALSLASASITSKKVTKTLNDLWDTFEQFKDSVPNILVPISLTLQNIIIKKNERYVSEMIKQSNSPLQFLQAIIAFIQAEDADKNDVLNILEPLSYLFDHCVENITGEEPIQAIAGVIQSLFRFECPELMYKASECLQVLFILTYDLTASCFQYYFDFIATCFSIENEDLYTIALKFIHTCASQENKRSDIDFSISRQILETFNENIIQILFSMQDENANTILVETPQTIITDIFQCMLSNKKTDIFEFIMQLFENNINSPEYPRRYGSIIMLFSFVGIHCVEIRDFLSNAFKVIINSETTYQCVGTIILSYDMISRLVNNYGVGILDPNITNDFDNFLQFSADKPVEIVKSAVYLLQVLCKLYSNNPLYIGHFKFFDQYVQAIMRRPDVWDPALCDPYFTALGNYALYSSEMSNVYLILKFLAGSLLGYLQKLSGPEQDESDILIVNCLLRSIGIGMGRYKGSRNVEILGNPEVYKIIENSIYTSIKHKNLNYYSTAIDALIQLSSVSLKHEDLEIVAPEIFSGIADGEQNSFNYGCVAIKFLSENTGAKFNDFAAPAFEVIMNKLFSVREIIQAESVGHAYLALGTLMRNNTTIVLGLVPQFFEAFDWGISNGFQNTVEDPSEALMFYIGVIVAETGLLKSIREIGLESAGDFPAKYMKLKSLKIIKLYNLMMSTVEIASIQNYFADLIEEMIADVDVFSAVPQLSYKFRAIFQRKEMKNFFAYVERNCNDITIRERCRSYYLQAMNL